MIPLALAALKQWKFIAIGALILTLGWSRLQLADERQARTEERAAALKLAAEIVDKNRQLEAKDAERARDLDAERMRAEAEINATRGDFERRLSERLRARRPACPNSLPAPTPSPGEPATAPAGSDDGHRTSPTGLRIRDSVKRLQADVRECWAWASQVGR